MSIIAARGAVMSAVTVCCPCFVHIWSAVELEVALTLHAASAVLCDVIIGDSLRQKLDNLSDTVTDNVRGTGTECSIFVNIVMV